MKDRCRIDLDRVVVFAAEGSPIRVGENVKAGVAGDDADIFSSMSWLAVPDEASAINDDRHFSVYMLIVIYRVKERVGKETGMRVSRERAAENRERIVETAAQLFREKGFDGIGVDAIMKGAGLTHGGFYGHFASKDDLAAEAVTRAFERGAEWQSHFTGVDDFVADYLSERHRADRANGCVLAALGADMARQGEAVRRELPACLHAQLDRLARLFRDGSAAHRRKRAITTLAGIVGALTLARAVDDPVLSKEILAAARDEFGEARPTDRIAARRPGRTPG
jgi:TetR/AcrR family transcriptional regulator, transcriptional repressor for nem operon